MPETTVTTEAVAIIAMAGRFPGAPTTAALWHNLRNGIEGIEFFTADELQQAGVPEELLAQPTYIKAGTTLPGATEFDFSYFGMNARDAELTDPQHRVFLECAHEALETAGYDPQTYEGLIGVYGSSTMSSYLINNLHRNARVMREAMPMELMLANDKDFLTTRISYRLNLRGPSMSVQTGCSSSLAAVHLACQALLDGSCDIALAGGVAIRFPQPSGYKFIEEGVYSADGHCRPFDARACGSVAGNGAGIVVLKRLTEAVADGDNIAAVIRGSSMSNDGSGKPGFTAPGADGIAEAAATAIAVSGVDADSISYVEAHGTATLMGDPIEFAGLAQAYSLSTAKRQYCSLGALKANTGSMETAGSVSGLIKTVLQMQHREIPPLLHYDRPNPAIDVVASPFFIDHELRPWQPAGDSPLRAGVNAFGIGGTNVHLIVEEAPLCPPGDPPRWPVEVLTFSAATASALERVLIEFAAFLRRNPAAALPDIAYTLHTGRTAHDYRAAIVCRSIEEAIAGAERCGRTAAQTQAVSQSTPAAALVFSSYDPGTAGGLNDLNVPVYRSALAECTQAASVRGIAIDDQPALWHFAAGYAGAKFLISIGLKRATLRGRGTGVLVPGVLSGKLTIDAAISSVLSCSESISQEEKTSASNPEGIVFPVDTDITPALAALARYWSEGGAVDWTAFHSGERRRRVPLPTYPFERRLCFVTPDSATPRSTPDPAGKNHIETSEDGIRRELAAVVADLLGAPSVGLDDDFFVLGGHSLLGLRLLTIIQERFAVSLPLRALRDHRTITALADAIAAAQLPQLPEDEDELLALIEGLDDEEVEAELARRFGREQE